MSDVKSSENENDETSNAVESEEIENGVETQSRVFDWKFAI